MALRGVLLLCLGVFAVTQNAQASSLERLAVGSFNIRWFGSAEHDSGFKLPSAKAERISATRQFLKEYLLPLDVIAFQEIVDLKALKKILPSGWKCLSYSHANKLHQHVALCASPRFTFQSVAYDDNHLIEEVASYDPDRARPAIRVDLARKDGARLVRIVAVHLKSAPHFAKLRIKQMKMIAEDLAKEPGLPTVVLGDFNSFSKEQTKLSKDDTVIFQEQLSKMGQQYELLVKQAQFTYRSGKIRGNLDHIYVSRGIAATKATVFSGCSRTREGSGFLNSQYYLRYVSDHCPISSKLKFLVN